MTDSFVHALAGSLGGAGAMAVTYPLERARTMLQLKNQGKSENHSLYQGCSAVIQTVAISNFLYFYSLQYSKRTLEKRLALSPVPLALASSTLAATVNILATEPLWKANTLLKTMPQKDAAKNTLFSLIVRIFNQEGAAALWSGTGVSLWLVSNPIIQFSVYEHIKSRFQARKQDFSPLHAFFFGALSKAIATLATYPLQVAQTRLRVSKDGNNMVHILVQLYKEKSMFKGCSAKLAQTVLTAAFMFAFYERIAQLIFSLLKRKK
jgi:adenine nucleotide transporter 17